MTPGAISRCKFALNRAWSAFVRGDINAGADGIRQQILEPYGDVLFPDERSRRGFAEPLDDPDQLTDAECLRIVSGLSDRLDVLGGTPVEGGGATRIVRWIAAIPMFALALALAVYLFHGARLTHLSARLYYVDETGFIGEPAFKSFEIPADDKWYRITIDLPGVNLLRVRIDPAVRGRYFDYVMFRNATLRAGETDVHNPLLTWHATNTDITRAHDTFTLVSDLDGPSILSEITYTEQASEFQFEVRASASRISPIAWIWRWPA